MIEEERKLWTKRIEDYRASGLTAVKWAEENNVLSIHLDIGLHNLTKKRKKYLKKHSGHQLFFKNQ